MIPNRLLMPFSAVLLAVFLLAALPGCAPRKLSGAAQSSPEAAWKVFRRYYCTPEKDPAVKVKASLQYSRIKPMKRTNRTLISMWGDFSGAMRLDVSAGIGKLLAHIREDGDGLLVFYPSDKKAYAHVNPVLGATRLGMPFPFSLNELAHVIVGDFSGLVPDSYARAERDGDRYTFVLDGGLVTQVTLDNTGRPILLEGRTTKAYDTARTWQLVVNKYEEPTGKATPLPGRLTLSLDNGEKGVLYIKARELRPDNWPASSLDLELPKTIETIRLDNGPRPDQDGDIPVVYEDKS